MFFPDKLEGAREARRVLRPGGLFLFSTWDAIEHNAVARITHETVAKIFPDGPPRHDLPVDRVAEDAAFGLIHGNPIYGEIMTRRPDALESVKAAVATNIRAELGDRPVRCPLRALVFQATRPTRSSPSR